ncbi:MAG: rRNA pseudouridine synthase [Chitinophagaceae bacterium]|nr:rRNA pseudouridine synthase [Chitinophagaceae bacterium]MBP6415401.1 rRNA pseudouridine synthase [Chitinophagaceae bacterium]
MKKKPTDNFSKFAPRKSNAAIKEQFKQEKRKFKKEREEYFDKKKAEERSQRPGARSRVPGTTTPPPIQIVHNRPVSDGQMPLNKFIAHSGVAARREAAEFVKKGLVKVNGSIITEPGHKVSIKDDIRVNGKKVFLAKNLVYILLNKPKDYITTTDDPQGRKTVLDIIGKATTERVYPVGRLDRNTSGVLLFTNDGELAQKLTHPSNQIKKVYHVTLNKPLEKIDFDRILKGIVLEDGLANVDVLAYADMKDKTQIGVEIHSGRNRIVRRIFEALGYDVRGLDRVIFAGLTKKNIERGKFRFLSEKEVRDLKHFGKGK